MKYIVDLPEEDATFLTTSAFIPVGYFEKVHEALHNATPLDSFIEGVKGEIEANFYDRPYSYNHPQRAEFFNEVLLILNKDISGKAVWYKKAIEDIKAEIETDLSYICFDDWGNEKAEWTQIKAVIDKNMGKEKE